MKPSTYRHADDGLSLDQLKVGETGLVGEIGPSASRLEPVHHKLLHRLMEIGFIPGEPLQVLHKGFFGGEPIAVRIGQSTFALRRFEAALISVIPHPQQSL